MITITNGYFGEPLAVVADRDEARAWCEANGFAFLSARPTPDQQPVARITTAAEWSDPK